MEKELKLEQEQRKRAETALGTAQQQVSALEKQGNRLIEDSRKRIVTSRTFWGS